MSSRALMLIAIVAIVFFAWICGPAGSADFLKGAGTWLATFFRSLGGGQR